MISKSYKIISKCYQNDPTALMVTISSCGPIRAQWDGPYGSPRDGPYGPQGMARTDPKGPELARTDPKGWAQYGPQGMANSQIVTTAPTKRFPFYSIHLINFFRTYVFLYLNIYIYIYIYIYI